MFPCQLKLVFILVKSFSKFLESQCNVSVAALSCVKTSLLLKEEIMVELYDIVSCVYSLHIVHVHLGYLS